ncbi:hypothetical protein FQV39_17240 [Bosea sp. F3-2]|uniref:hypothetical protein n=1 Tax=Bosea sp. F3-2 TaxID=2599640 RepID=UPI0011EBA1C8|nr:hypothetical protein [Bosea sp. F3-2]QEL24131.1 hypothetical protein FQV39_17240 [Bosea sp. F3-2]
MEKDLSEALKKCGVSTIFFRPELFQSQPVNGLVAPGGRDSELYTRFGQARFVQRFPLYLNGLYASPEKEETERDSATVKQAALGSTVRGGLIEDNSDDLGQPTVKSGLVTWAAVPPVFEPGARISRVRADLILKDSKVALNLVLIPEEAGKGLMILVKLTGERGAEFGVPRMRRTGDRSGEPMDMVSRRQGDGETAFVPAAEPQALQNIASALLRGQWIDVPVRLRGEPSYILTMELARPGKALLTRALSDWGLSVEGR